MVRTFSIFTGKRSTWPRSSRLIDINLPEASRGLIAFGGSQIPMPPSLDDTALRALIEGLPRTSVEAGIAETIRRFAALRDSGTARYVGYR